MRSPLLLTSLLWLLFASAALAAEPAVVEGAKKEGALVFYTTMDIQNSKPLLDAFIKISLHQGRSRASGRHRDGEPHHDRGPGQRKPVRRGRRYFTVLHADARAQSDRALYVAGVSQSVR